MSEEKKTPQQETMAPQAQPDQQAQGTHEDIAAELEAEKQEIYEKQANVFKRMSAYDDQLREEKKVRQFSGKNAILAALVVLVVAVALVLIVPALLPEPQEEETPAATVQARTYTFSDRTKDDVANVTLHQDGQTLRLARNVAGEFVATDYPDAELNQTNAGSVFYAVANLKAVDTVADDSSRAADFGLADPDCYAEVTYTDGSTATYYLGDRAPNGTNYYFKAEGNDAIYMVAVSVNTYFRRTLEQLRTLQELPTFDFENCDRMTIRSASGVIDMRTRDQDEVNVNVSFWTMLEPYQSDVDGEALSDLQDDLATLSIESHVGPVSDLKEYGLDEDQAYHLYLHDTDGNELDVTIGAARNSTEYYALIGGEEDVYTVGYQAAQAVLNAEVISLVDSFASIVTISYVDAMDVYLPDGQVVNVTIDRQEQYDENGQLMTLANGDPNYLETYTVNGKVYENDPFKAMYQALIGVTIDGLVDLDENGAPVDVGNETYAKIVYHFNVDVDDLTVEYRPYKSLYYAVNKGGDYYFYVNRSKLEKALDAVTNLIGS